MMSDAQQLSPRPGTPSPAPAHIDWHTREVFKGNPLIPLLGSADELPPCVRGDARYRAVAIRQRLAPQRYLRYRWRILGNPAIRNILHEHRTLRTGQVREDKGAKEPAVPAWRASGRRTS